MVEHVSILLEKSQDIFLAGEFMYFGYFCDLGLYMEKNPYRQATFTYGKTRRESPTGCFNSRPTYRPNRKRTTVWYPDIQGILGLMIVTGD